MQFDRKSVNQLLSLSDSQLRRLIDRLAADAGVDLSALNISTNDLSALRKTLDSASDSDLTALAAQIEAQTRANGGRHGQ